MYGRRTASDHIPHLYNYLGASRHFDEVPTIRGKDIKPIGHRRYTYMTIRKDPDESIACRLYQTDVVTFHKDGRIVINCGGYATQTTSQFIMNVLDQYCRVFYNRLWICARPKGGAKELQYALHPIEDNVFTRDTDARLILHNPIVSLIHRINRKQANNVRATYKDFRKYVTNVCKLRMDVTTGEVQLERGEVAAQIAVDKNGCAVTVAPLWVNMHYKLNTDQLKKFMGLITKEQDEDKTEDYYKAFLWLAFGLDSFRRYNYVTREGLLKALDDVLFLVHRDEVFERQDVTGSMLRDPYAKFFGQSV